MQLAIISEDVSKQNAILKSILLHVSHLYDRIFYLGDFPDAISSIEDIFKFDCLVVISHAKYFPERMKYSKTDFILVDAVIIDTEISMQISAWILYQSERMIARICNLGNISRPVINWRANSYLMYSDSKFIASNSLSELLTILFPPKSCPLM